MRKLALVLMHHPILDGAGNEVTTAITNLDLHDIARSARTYGVWRYFVAHPISAQRELANKVRDHWVDGRGGKRIPDRRPAMERLQVVAQLSDVREAAEELGEGAPVMWATSARSEPGRLGHAAGAKVLQGDGPPVVLILGTGWGLAPSVMSEVDAVLSPIVGCADGYNHLSVRAAAAILLDRLVGAQRE